ncbi:hypothetical protein [Caulobacter sp. 17J80-11]|uniref:hypothetical protein n=1 Tax=Caulobacter sp. 17J80-11 TaxID=2763502 RepID=UPI00165354F5|nr:hypothetical protein [Caulobacter sp. 17J80-11]MBC6982760.1 hypothetical protein [Caulobacter sp. 17J80-11]
MSEPERKAEVVSLRDVRRRKEQAAKAARPKPVGAVPRQGREPIVKSWRNLAVFIAVLVALALVEALFRRLF